MVPDASEAKGLLALLLYCESRRAARRVSSGNYVPLSSQDASLWSRPQIQEAEQVLSTALAQGPLARYQIEAAIQSAHVARILAGRDNLEAIVTLYDALVAVMPSVGALIGRAAAIAEHRGAGMGLLELDEIDHDLIQTHQPYWAVRGDFLAKLNCVDEAFTAYTYAIGLTEDPAVRQFLLRKRTALIN